MKHTIAFLILLFLTGCSSNRVTQFDAPIDTATQDTTSQMEIPQATNEKLGASVESINRQATQNFITKGMQQATSGNFEGALEMFESALEIAPEDMRKIPINNKARILYTLERYEEAITQYDQLIEMEPNNSNFLSDKGAALLKLGQYEEALNIYDQSLAITQDNFPAYYNKACIYALMGNEADALRHLRIAFELNSEAKTFAVEDTDLQNLWDNEEFLTLVE